MTTRRTTLLVAVLTAAVVLGLLGFLATVIYLANTTVMPGPSTVTITRINIGLTAYAVLSGMSFFTVLVAVGWDDRINRRRFSSLYLPLVTTALAIAIVGLLLAVGAADRLFNDLRPRWMLTNEPELQLFNTAVIVGVFLGIGWGATVVMLDSGWDRRLVAAIVTAVLVFAGLATWAAFRVAG